MTTVDTGLEGGVAATPEDLEKADNYYGEYSGYGNRYYRKYGYYGKDRATT